MNNILKVATPEQDYSKLQKMEPIDLVMLLYQKSDSKNLPHICYEILEAGCNEVAIFEAIKIFKKLPATDPHEKNSNGKQSLFDLPHHLSKLHNLYKLNHTDEEHREVFMHAMKYAYLGEDYITSTFTATEHADVITALHHFMTTGEPLDGYRFYGNLMHKTTEHVKENLADTLEITSE